MIRVFRASFFPVICAVVMMPAAFAQSATENKPAPDRAAAYYHYGLAKMYEDQAVTNGRQDQATQAIEQYKLALSADPDSRLLEDGLANLYFRLGRIREAVSAAQDQVTKHPDDADAHILLGRVYLRSLGDGQGPQSAEMLKAAIHEYEKISALKPNDLETRLLLGQLYGLNHDSAKAEAQFKAAQKIDGTSEEVVLSMARLYTEQGNLAKAAEVIAAVPQDDRTARMEFALAGMYDQLGKPKDAAEAYRATLAEDPDNQDAKRGLAKALTNAGKSDEAAKLYAQMLGSDPQDAQALIDQAKLQRQNGNYEDALTTLKKAEGLASDNLELNFNEALCYDALGRMEEGIAKLKQILDATSNEGKYSDADKQNRALFLERLAILQRYEGKTADAVATYKEMQALGGDLQVRGTDGEVQAYRDGHEWGKALEAAEAAAKAMPTNRRAQLTYASQLGDADRVDEALKLANAQLNKNARDDMETYFTIAEIDARAKRWKDALAATDKIEPLTTKPEEKAGLADYRATLAERQKMHDQAEDQYRKGLALDPDSASIQNDYGYLLADRGVRLDEALTMLKKAVKFDPQNGSYLDSLAWAYYKMGQYTLALDYSQKAVQRMNGDPTVRDHLGEIYAKSGKLQLAVEEWERALKEYHTSLPPEADPGDVAKLEHKLEGARVRLAHATPVK